MSNNLNLRNITNSFLDVRLVSLSSWRQANEITPRDRGGPYVILQEGYDPNDPNVSPDEFVLGRSGKWLPLGLFYRLPVPDRRAEFIFGTAAEVMAMMGNLTSAVVIFRPADKQGEAATPESDEMIEALHKGKGAGSGSGSKQ
jgi:hypothetical protein